MFSISAFVEGRLNSFISFPVINVSNSLKAFRENCCNWRHRSGLVEQWSRTSLSLTRKLLDFMSPSRMATRKETSSVVIPKDMSKDCIAQTWFRFIHSLGNPVEFSKPQSIAQTQYFLQYGESGIQVTYLPHDDVLQYFLCALHIF